MPRVPKAHEDGGLATTAEDPGSLEFASLTHPKTSEITRRTHAHACSPTAVETPTQQYRATQPRSVVAAPSVGERLLLPG